TFSSWSWAASAITQFSLRASGPPVLSRGRFETGNDFGRTPAMHDVTLIPGDGIGPDVVAAAKKVLDHATSSINWDVVQAGEEAYRKQGNPVPPEVIDSLRRTRLGLKGPMGVPTAGYASPNTEIRNAMGLWCNIRMAIHFEGARSPHVGTDIVLVRDVT